MKNLIVGLVSAIFFAATAQAGQGPIIEDVEVVDLGGGLTRVTGSLIGVRFTDDDVQQIGCRIAADRLATPFLACFARDINANNHGCFSFDPTLIEAAKSISPYSFVRFVFDETGECVFLGASTRSFHIPDKYTEKGKSN
jgi:hypothetical protein